MQVQRGGRHEVDRWLRLEVARDFGAENGIPWNVVSTCDVDHQRNIAIRTGRQHELALEPHEAGNYVRPGIEPMPRKVEIVGHFVVELFQPEFRTDLIEHAPVE